MIMINVINKAIIMLKKISITPTLSTDQITITKTNLQRVTKTFKTTIVKTLTLTIYTKKPKTTTT